MTYAIEAAKTRSEKITLVTVESVEQVRLFTANGADWDRVTNYFVIGVKENGSAITSWSYTPTTKTLKIIGGTDPKSRKISLTYRHFYSSAPVNLPYDLLNGEVIEWEPRVMQIGAVGQRLDNESTGIVLESSSSIDLENTDGYFDSIFDTQIWENQDVKFYSWFPNIPISEKIQLFEGVVETKTFSDKKVNFRVKDFVFKLRNKLTQRTYGDMAGAGKVLAAYFDAPSARIYGQADNVKCVSADAILDGIDSGSGTISGSMGSTSISVASYGSLGLLTPGDELIFTIAEVEYKIGIEAVSSDTALIASKELEVNVPALTTFKVKPKYPSRYSNRNWLISGHKLREAQTEILIVDSSTTFLVSSVDEFAAGDEVTVAGVPVTIRRISGSKIVTSTAVNPLPVASDIIKKRAIKKVYLKERELVYIRDYSEVNTTTICRIELDPLAEFNISEQRLFTNSFTFTNGSNSITTADQVDLRSIVKPNDWIRSISSSRATWYEILEVKEKEIILRSDIAVIGGPFTETAYYKSIDTIDENSLVTVNCLGMDYNNTWVKTASDAARHLMLNDAGFASVNEASFSSAKKDCSYTVSIVEPPEPGQGSPAIRDVVTKLNNSVFGSLYGNSSQSISYSILNSKKPETISPLRDDDILSFSVSTTQKIYNEILVKYRPYIDRFSGNSTFKTVTYNSGFVDSYIGIQNKLEKIIYIYNDSDAENIAQRLALFNSMAISTVEIKAKMNLAETVVNDKIYLELDRLYSRYGGLDRRKLGIVVGVSRNGFNTDLSITDLGNIFNRVPSIAPNSTLDYSSSSSDDKIRWGYVLDNDTLTPVVTDEEGLGNFIIG